MIILNTNLTKNDYKFASNYLRIILLTRNNKDTKDYEKHITPLAEEGQVEAMELYCKGILPLSTLNSKIVLRFKELENKPLKEPRDYFALYYFYNTFVESYKFSNKTNKVEHLEAYQKAKQCYNNAYGMLSRLGKVDPIAQQWAFILENHEIKDEEYYRTLSNLRNKIYEKAYDQKVNERTKLKLQFNYALNVVNFASDNEFLVKSPFLNRINSDLKKAEGTYGETRSRF